MALIVELFGPPGSGKTTFAKALAAQLSRSGTDVGLHLSSRPGESGAGGPSGAIVSRLLRPFGELIAIRGDEADAAGLVDGDQLSPFLAQFGWFTRLRLRQYLYRLTTVWARAKASPGVFIFDQGYLQFVVTLLSQRWPANSGDVGGALQAVSRADIALHLDPGPRELERRLGVRQRKIGAFGRLLERGAGGSEAYAVCSDLVQKELESRGRAVLRTPSLDDEGLAMEIKRVVGLIERFETVPAGVAT